ncbi:hypothetical protein CEE44_01805 [Candidatus Woesearchaeota archaeon B3_Woes]|nr:MAG: hypothetical protein CEE44_01805 [Candidatus Woesearchaeota archaeon B3_Woes]
MEKSKFFKNIEKRIRKDIRVNKLFQKNDRIYVKDKLSRFFIDKIIGTLPKTFTNDLKKANKKVIKYTLDDECNDFLEKLFYNKKKKQVKEIKLLRTITDKEALLFSRYNHIKFSPNKKNKKIKELLDSLEKSYPQTRFSLAKSIESLK